MASPFVMSLRAEAKDLVIAWQESLGALTASCPLSLRFQCQLLLSLQFQDFSRPAGAGASRGELSSRLVFVLQVLEAVPEADGRLIRGLNLTRP